MALVTQDDIEQYTGFKYSDFTENGLEMTAVQWTDFIAKLIPKVTQMIHRYCNVVSFEPTSYTEYHNGRGNTNYDTAVADYNEEDRVYFLRQLYCDTLLVYEDTSTKNAAPNWVLRTVRATGVAGDYEIIQENDVTRIRFHNNIPAEGTTNIKFIYNSGYPLNSKQLDDIRFQCLRAIKNVLLTKKKIQEASSIRNFGVRDYSQMFDAFSEGVVISDKVKSGLEQYRRAIIPGQFAYE
jgi:hypothetical protein